MTSDPPIDEIRRVRREISAAFGHDLKKLVAHYQEMQKEFADRLVNHGAKPTAVLANQPGLSTCDHADAATE